MALAYPTNAVVVRITLVDEAGDQSVKEFVMDPASYNLATDTVAAIQALVDALITDINVVTDALIKTSSISITQTDTAALYGAAGSEIAELANVSIDLATAGKPPATVSIPAPNIGIFVGTEGPSMNIVDITDAGLLAYLDNFESAAGDFFVSDGEYLSAAAGATRSGKRLHRRTKVG